MNRSTRWWHRGVAVIGLVGASPIVTLASIAIRVSDGAPVLYRTRRVGRDGAEFTMFKFRTMRIGSERHGAITASVDSRVFPIGRTLRRLKIDEVPQLINVVKGEMALVGPRPEDPNIVKAHYQPWMLETLEVAPGLTSPGSLAYYDDEQNLPDNSKDAEEYYVRSALARKIALDLVYVRRRSTMYDLNLIVRTIMSIIGLPTICPRRVRHEMAEADLILASAKSVDA